MLKISIKQVATICMTLFVFAMAAATQPAITYAAAASVGVVNYQQLINQHPDMAQAQDTMNAAIKQAQDDFNSKSANMSDQEKQSYYQQLQQGLQVKKQELLEAIQSKVDAAVKAVAEAKGITIIVDKNAVVYGGQDITDDVMKKISGK